MGTTMVAQQVAVVLHTHEQGLPEQHACVRAEGRFEPVCDEQLCMVAGVTCPIFQCTLIWGQWCWCSVVTRSSGGVPARGRVQNPCGWKTLSVPAFCRHLCLSFLVAFL